MAIIDLWSGEGRQPSGPKPYRACADPVAGVAKWQTRLTQNQLPDEGVGVRIPSPAPLLLLSTPTPNPLPKGKGPGVRYKWSPYGPPATQGDGRSVG